MDRKWFPAFGILLSIVLLALPCSVAMGGRYYSHLSFTPAAAGNWFPALAVIFALLALVFLLMRREYGQMAPICLGLSLASQVLSWRLFSSFSLISLAVVLLQTAVLLQKQLARLPLHLPDLS